MESLKADRYQVRVTRGNFSIRGCPLFLENRLLKLVVQEQRLIRKLPV